MALATSWLAILSAPPLHAEPAPFMMRATVNGRVVEGQPLTWNRQQILLLARDGALHEFHPDDAKDASKTAARFVSYTNDEIQSRLREEFGRAFEVSTTAHFVVVHPRDWNDWADRLESLYRSFTHYMGVRGFQIAPPTTTLVAIVFRNQDDYYRYAAAGGTALATGTMGHYDPTSNRIYLFDVHGGAADADWSANAETIIHEATHQTAYNTGVHRRFAEQPRWLVEGLAMMFEAPGVWGAASHHTPADRLNRERLSYYHGTGEQRSSDWITPLVASDAGFDATPLTAYAETWMLTFYLCETRPLEYSQYLARVASRETFSKYLPHERLTDFTAAFGRDLSLIAAQLGRFAAELP